MLSRYRIVRGQRPPSDPLPEGVRLDTRKHTQSKFRPTPELVASYLAAPNDESFARFSSGYRSLLSARIQEDPAAFQAVVERARSEDVYLGCNCPTKKNPDVTRCHTVLALRFMQARYPDLTVLIPTE